MRKPRTKAVKKEDGKLLKVKIPKGHWPDIFEQVGDTLYIWCSKKVFHVAFKFKR